MAKRTLIGMCILALFVQCKRQYGLNPIQLKMPEIVRYEPDSNFCYSQAPIILPMPDPHQYYWQAFHEITAMLEGSEPLEFKRAVFISENPYFDNTLNYNNFCDTINQLANLCNMWMKVNPLVGYKYRDSVAIAKNRAIFHIMTDTTWARLLDLKAPVQYPYTYDFKDYFGEADWKKTLLIKLLRTNSGNCHSLPFLYKILAEELETKAYLAFAPNHMYIKQRCDEFNWYNTELTSAVFPMDAWIMASGYISIEAIQNGMYMKAVDEKQSIAVCLFDLAEGYKHKFGLKNNSGFILDCCNTALTYYPNFANAMLLKAETLRYSLKQVQKETGKNGAFTEMQNTYLKLANMGYREMPTGMYREWITAVEKEKEKYQNIKINRTFKPKTN
jgi:hypothetical protein